MKNEKDVIEFLIENKGYITTSDFLYLGINKSSIKNYIKKGVIERVSHGLYMDKKQLEDEYYIFQKKYPEAIFSYDSALYILNLSDRVPMTINITVPRDKKVRGKYKIHRISKNYYDIGIKEKETPYGNIVKVYDAERCICDMIKKSNDFDIEYRNKVLDCYFKNKDKDIDKLLNYAKKLKVYDKVNTIVEIMMKW